MLISLGLFNVIFLPGYFTTGYRTGKPGVIGAIVFFLSYGVFELLVALVPGAADTLDTLDPAMAGPQLIVLVVGALVFGALTWVAHRQSVSRFDRVNL